MFELMEGWERIATVGGSALVIWRHDVYGKYACGLFRLHDEKGFSLTDSLIECNRRGWKPCLQQFRADALRAGWSREKIEQTVSAALADASSVGLAGFASVPA